MKVVYYKGFLKQHIDCGLIKLCKKYKISFSLERETCFFETLHRKLENNNEMRQPEALFEGEARVCERASIEADYFLDFRA